MALSKQKRAFMLRIGKLTDYAMLIMSHMAKQTDKVMSAANLADALHLTAPTVSKILKMLGDARLLDSVRGAEGGYHLAKPATQISVADVLAAMEGDLALTECCDTEGLCGIDTKCALKGNWRKINRLVHSLLSRVTIVDMVEPLSLEHLLAVASHD
jgi:FeS assembly SUF system regulator